MIERIWISALNCDYSYLLGIYHGPVSFRRSFAPKPCLIPKLPRHKNDQGEEKKENNPVNGTEVPLVVFGEMPPLMLSTHARDAVSTHKNTPSVNCY
jgi:hypothetical protein